MWGVVLLADKLMDSRGGRGQKDNTPHSPPCDKLMDSRGGRGQKDNTSHSPPCDKLMDKNNC
jgi:hypothetical protein